MEQYITARLRRKIVLLIDAEKYYPVSYTYTQSREKINEWSVLQGKYLTENQIIELWKYDCIF